MQVFSGDRNIDGKTDTDNLVLILKPAGGVMIAEKNSPDEARTDNPDINIGKLYSSGIYLLIAILSFALSLRISPPTFRNQSAASEIREVFAGNRPETELYVSRP